MGNLTPLEEVVLESLTTESSRRSKEIDKIVEEISFRFNGFNMYNGIKTKKPFNMKLVITPPFGFGDALSLWFDTIDLLADDSRVNISDVKKKFTVKLYGEKIIYPNNCTPGLYAFTKMKYRNLVIDIDPEIGRVIHSCLDCLISMSKSKNKEVIIWNKG